VTATTNTEAATADAAIAAGSSVAASPVAGDRRTVVQGGRAKAYRPLPAVERRRAYEAGVAAYERGDFFEAHEILEPAWMGTDDLAERELYQGLIKLAAAFVHGVRGNPLGIARNLAGAHDRLAAAEGTGAADASGLDLARLVADVEGLLAHLASHPGDASVVAPRLHGTAERGATR
jgi:predicted metal-dependent hydrolase